MDSSPLFELLVRAHLLAGLVIALVTVLLTRRRDLAKGSAPSVSPVRSAPRYGWTTATPFAVTLPAGVSDGVSPPSERAEEVSTEIEIGSVVGHHVIERRLGAGGFATVFAVRHARTGALGAMKVLHVVDALRPDAADALAREARILGAIDHPAVPRVLDSGWAPGGIPFLVTEIVDGETLEDRLLSDEMSGGTSVEAAMEWLIATLDVIAHLAAAGITHADLSPANVLLDRAGRVHVIDFGLAVDRSEGAGNRGIVGTPGFLSPEQARGEGALIGEASDVFAACAIFHLAVTGMRIHEARSCNQVLLRTAFFPVPSIARLRPLPPPLALAIDRGLAFDPSVRPRAAALRDMLAAQLGRMKQTTSRIATRRYGRVLPA